MTSEPTTAPLVLAARAANVYSANHLMAYAQLSPTLTILQISPNFAPMALPEPTAAEAILNHSLTEVLWEFVGAEEALKDVLAGDAPFFRLEHVNRGQSDGTMNYLTFSVYRLAEANSHQGLLLLVEDVTAYGRLHHQLVQDRNELRLIQNKLATTNEELTRIDRMKSLFLSMAAHDLRAPLSAIHGYSELMLMGITEIGSPKSRHYIDIIHQQSARLNQLIDDVVDLDIIEQGKLVIHPEPCDINQLLTEVLTAFKFSLEHRHITVQSNFSATPATIAADPEKMLRVFYNLIGNAIKYMPDQGKMTLTTAEEADKLVIEIEDNGAGMSQAQIDKLFTLYYRTSEAEESVVKGSGLGLFIVKTMVEAHQGTIMVESKRNKGSKFTIQLPKWATKQA